MKNAAYNNPKDGQITNDDTAVTNKDGDNVLEKGAHLTNEDEADVDRIPTDDDNMGDPTPLTEEDEHNSNKGQGPAGENL